jgi:uncharacterized protein (DUF608 family)
LDGQWMCRLNGLPGVFPEPHVQTVLNTILNTCLVPMGLAGFADPTGRDMLAEYGSFPPEMNIVAMTFMYHNLKDVGLEIVRRNMDNLIRVQGHGWDLPNLIRCDTGERTYGCDYFQNMILWAVPAALAGEDLSGPCKPGGLVNRILQAAISGENNE